MGRKQTSLLRRNTVDVSCLLCNPIADAHFIAKLADVVAMHGAASGPEADIQILAARLPVGVNRRN